MIEEKDVKEEVDVPEGEAEKTFTQTELDKIITERLARAKAEKPEDYEDLQTIASDLEEYGFVGTVAEKKKALKAAKEKIKADRELEEIEEEAANSGNSPEILKKLKDAEKKLKDKEAKLKELTDVEEAKRKEIEEQTAADEDWERQLGEFTTAHEDIDIEELAKDTKFTKYAKNHKGELKEIYEDYLELMEEASQNIAEKFKRSESRSTGSGKNVPASGSAKLSSDQQKTLDDWNKRYPKMKMTPQEFIKR